MDTMLPIGSIVELENDDKKYVILGFLHQEMKDNVLNVYQYTACEYSLGIDDKNEFVYFDEDKIDSLVYMGYALEFDRVFLRILYELFNELRKATSLDGALDKVLTNYFKDDEVKKKEIKDLVINSYVNGGIKNE